MRVLHIDTGREMRGGQWQAFYLMQGLKARGHENRLLARTDSPLASAARSAGIRVQPLHQGITQLANDIVHAHDARGHTLGVLLRRPLVVSRRVAFPLSRTLPSRVKYQAPATFLAVSQFVARQMIEDGVQTDRIQVVYDGVPIPQQIAALRGKRILALDSSDPLKGKLLLSEAARHASLPISFSVDLPKDLAAASLFVYITESEGLGSAVLLAMGAGVPVVASRVGGIPELIEHEVNGLLVENDPEAIAAAMQRLNSDAALAIRLRNEARHRVVQHFSVDTMVEATLAAYNKVLS